MKQVAKGVMWQRGETCKTTQTCNDRNVLVVDVDNQMQTSMQIKED